MRFWYLMILSVGSLACAGISPQPEPDATISGAPSDANGVVIEIREDRLSVRREVASQTQPGFELIEIRGAVDVLPAGRCQQVRVRNLSREGGSVEERLAADGSFVLRIAAERGDRVEISATCDEIVTPLTLDIGV